MNFNEYVAKRLLIEVGLTVPKGILARSPDEAEDAAREIGPCVVKAQVPTGKRGKAGGIKLAADPSEARAHAHDILGQTIAGYRVETLLIEGQVDIAHELYAAVLNDPRTLAPAVLISTMGGMDVEDATDRDPTAMFRIPVEIGQGLTYENALESVKQLNLSGGEDLVADALVRLYQAYRENDAELMEINPLAVTHDARVVALDCKFTMDDAAAPRQAHLAEQAAPERLNDLERAAMEADLKYIELGGSVGVLANGAGLTMTSMDAIDHFGGAPANFLEVGGEAYTKTRTALEILLRNPNIRSLLVNFCGAFARTDVMAEGVVAAWKELKPDIPVFFTIHGTGEEQAIALVRRELRLEPFEHMDDAVAAAVAAARKPVA